MTSNLKLSRLDISRAISYLYLLAVCIMWTEGLVFGTYWPVLIIIGLLLIQLIIRLPLADGIIGSILSLIALYMFLALSSDLADHFNGTKPVGTFGTYFLVGYSIILLTFTSATTLLYAAVKTVKRDLAA